MNPRPAIEWFLVIAAVATGAPGCGDRRALAPQVPELLTPFGGAWTGSVWAERSLRPRFQWTAVPGAARYQIQVDDSCSANATCSFPSPELDTLVTSTELEPRDPLPVALTPPVGRRYFWHVRACNDVDCEPWSLPRYVNVGRQRQDFNGDGYGDLLTRSFEGYGTVEVRFGGPLGTVGDEPGWKLSGDPAVQVGGWSLWPGDMNGDGVPDLATAAYDRGMHLLRIYAGGAALQTSPALEIEDPDSIEDLQRISDVNGDGFDDLAVVRSSAPRYEILLGGNPLARGASRELHLPEAAPEAVAWMVGVGDVDRDGEADVVVDHAGSVASLSRISWTGGDRPAVVERPFPLGPLLDQMTIIAGLGDSLGNGSAFALFATSAPGDASWRVRAASLDGDVSASSCDAEIVRREGPIAQITDLVPAPLGDIDGDGRDDFALGDWEANRVYLVFGGCHFERVLALPGPLPTTDPNGWVNAPKIGGQINSPGDMDGDGFPEIAVGKRLSGIDSFLGQVLVYRGGPTVAPSPTLIFPSATTFHEGFSLGQ